LRGPGSALAARLPRQRELPRRTRGPTVEEGGEFRSAPFSLSRALPPTLPAATCRSYETATVDVGGTGDRGDRGHILHSSTRFTAPLPPEAQHAFGALR